MSSPFQDQEREKIVFPSQMRRVHQKMSAAGQGLCRSWLLVPEGGFGAQFYETGGTGMVYCLTRQRVRMPLLDSEGKVQLPVPAA